MAVTGLPFQRRGNGLYHPTTRAGKMAAWVNNKHDGVGRPPLDRPLGLRPGLTSEQLWISGWRMPTRILSSIEALPSRKISGRPTGCHSILDPPTAGLRLWNKRARARRRELSVMPCHSSVPWASLRSSVAFGSGRAGGSTAKRNRRVTEWVANRVAGFALSVAKMKKKPTRAMTARAIGVTVL